MAQRQFRSDDTSKWFYGFGNGHDGSTYVTPAYAGCSGTISTKAVTIDTASTFADGDLVLIHQSRGTSAGVWELNKIASGGGTTSLTMEHDLMNTYTDSGASQAQVIELKEYNNLTVSSTITAPLWDGNKGGIIAFLDKGTATISGSLVATGRGFDGYPGDTDPGRQGEGTPSIGGTRTTAANGSGAGGGAVGGSNRCAGGGGGGHATSGGTGGTGGTGSAGGVGGGVVGNAALTLMDMGGAGGSGGGDIGAGGSAGNGGGIIVIIAKQIVVTGTIYSRGNNGGATSGTYEGCGGAGAGGSVLLKAEIATLGTTKIVATGGTGGTYSGAPSGGSGGTGRIHLDYSGSYTGTTSPTIDATLDSTIVPPSVGGAAFLAFFM